MTPEEYYEYLSSKTLRETIQSQAKGSSTHSHSINDANSYVRSNSNSNSRFNYFGGAGVSGVEIDLNYEEDEEIRRFHREFNETYRRNRNIHGLSSSFTSSTAAGAGNSSAGLRSSSFHSMGGGSGNNNNNTFLNNGTINGRNSGISAASASLRGSGTGGTRDGRLSDRSNSAIDAVVSGKDAYATTAAGLSSSFNSSGGLGRRPFYQTTSRALRTNNNMNNPCDDIESSGDDRNAKSFAGGQFCYQDPSFRSVLNDNRSGDNFDLRQGSASSIGNSSSDFDFVPERIYRHSDGIKKNISISAGNGRSNGSPSIDNNSNLNSNLNSTGISSSKYYSQHSHPLSTSLPTNYDGNSSHFRRADDNSTRPFSNSYSPGINGNVNEVLSGNLTGNRNNYFDGHGSGTFSDLNDAKRLKDVQRQQTRDYFQTDRSGSEGTLNVHSNFNPNNAVLNNSNSNVPSYRGSGSSLLNGKSSLIPMKTLVEGGYSGTLNSAMDDVYRQRHGLDSNVSFRYNNSESNVPSHNARSGVDNEIIDDEHPYQFGNKNVEVRQQNFGSVRDIANASSQASAMNRNFNNNNLGGSGSDTGVHSFGHVNNKSSVTSNPNFNNDNTSSRNNFMGKDTGLSMGGTGLSTSAPLSRGSPPYNMPNSTRPSPPQEFDAGYEELINASSMGVRSKSTSADSDPSSRARAASASHVELAHGVATFAAAGGSVGTISRTSPDHDDTVSIDMMIQSKRRKLNSNQMLFEMLSDVILTKSPLKSSMKYPSNSNVHAAAANMAAATAMSIHKSPLVLKTKTSAVQSPFSSPRFHKHAITNIGVGTADDSTISVGSPLTVSPFSKPSIMMMNQLYQQKRHEQLLQKDNMSVLDSFNNTEITTPGTYHRKRSDGTTPLGNTPIMFAEYFLGLDNDSVMPPPPPIFQGVDGTAANTGERESVKRTSGLTRRNEYSAPEETSTPNTNNLSRRSFTKLPSGDSVSIPVSEMQMDIIERREKLRQETQVVGEESPMSSPIVRRDDAESSPKDVKEKKPRGRPRGKGKSTKKKGEGDDSTQSNKQAYNNDSTPSAAVIAALSAELRSQLQRSSANNDEKNEGVNIATETTINFASAMETSQFSQQSIHDWDRKFGLRRAHSKTMRESARSRRKVLELLKGDLLKKDGEDAEIVTADEKNTSDAEGDKQTKENTDARVSEINEASHDESSVQSDDSDDPDYYATEILEVKTKTGNDDFDSRMSDADCSDTNSTSRAVSILLQTDDVSIGTLSHIPEEDEAAASSKNQASDYQIAEDRSIYASLQSNREEDEELTKMFRRASLEHCTKANVSETSNPVMLMPLNVEHRQYNANSA